MEKTISKMVQIISYILILLVISTFFFLLNVSPGKPKPVTGPDGKSVEGSFSEKVFLTIGGVRQGMFIKG